MNILKKIDVQLFLSKSSRHLLYVWNVTFLLFSIHKYIIKINNKKVTNKGLEYLFHDPHKGARCIRESKWHN